MSSKKVPKIFRKELKDKKWKKKILKNIHIPADRDFVEALYEESDGRMGIRRELTKEERKRLKPLAKALKKNKGMVTKWKLFILLALAGLILLFNIFFKNSLAERALEKGLGTAFESSVEADGLKLSLIRGELSLEGLSVQNRQEPDRNLFVTGRTALNISIPELSRGRYHIDTVELKGLRFGTGRESSELPPDAEGGEKGDPLLDLSEYTDDPAAAAQRLLEEQKDKLKSLAYIDTAEEELKAFTERWKETLDREKEETEAFISRYEGILSRGVPPVGSIDEGRALVEEYKGYGDEIRAEKDEAEVLYKTFTEERKALTGIREEAERLLKEDMETLRGLMDLPDRGDVQNFVTDKVKEVLSQRFSSLFETVDKFLPYYEKWRAAQPEEKKKKVRRLPGETVTFPSPMRPRFLLKKAHVDGGDERDGFFRAEVTGISDEAEKWPDPIRLSSGWEKDESSMVLEGFLDLKEEAPQLFALNFSAPAEDLDYKEGIPALGIDGAEMKLDYSGSARPVEEGVLVRLDMNFTDILLRMPEKDDPVSAVVRDSLKDIDAFPLRAEITLGSKGIRDIKIDSEIDRIMKDALAGVMENLPGAGQAELEKLMREMLVERLNESAALEEAADRLGLDSLDQIRSLDDLESAADKKKAEITEQGEALVKEYEDKARAEAERLQAEAEQARREAEEKARAEAEKRLQEEASKIKLPGF